MSVYRGYPSAADSNGSQDRLMSMYRFVHCSDSESSSSSIVTGNRSFCKERQKEMGDIFFKWNATENYNYEKYKGNSFRGRCSANRG